MTSKLKTLDATPGQLLTVHLFPYVTMTYKLDPDILKIYLHIKISISSLS